MRSRARAHARLLYRVRIVIGEVRIGNLVCASNTTGCRQAHGEIPCSLSLALFQSRWADPSLGPARRMRSIAAQRQARP